MLLLAAAGTLSFSSAQFLEAGQEQQEQQQTDSAPTAATQPEDIEVIDSEDLKQSIINDLRPAGLANYTCLKIEQRFMNS
jgi:hypothetical protein